MAPFLEKVGVAIASRLGITAAIATIVAALLGGGYWWAKSRGPREMARDKETGAKVEVEDLCFYGKRGARVDGRVYRPAGVLDETMPVVIYCQDRNFGDAWCRSLAGMGVAGYCFDFQGESEKARSAELDTVLQGIQKLRYADKDRIYLLGEAHGCLTASALTFDKPRQIKGLILVSPGFNPLEISRKAKRYDGTILVLDDAQGRKANLEEIKDFIY